MYIQLIDKHGWKSPILYFHADTEEWKSFIRQWRRDLLVWRANHPKMDGFPLGRLEPGNCMVDLLHKATNYYVETMNINGGIYETHAENHIIGSIKLVDFPKNGAEYDVGELDEYYLVHTYDTDDELGE